MRSPKQPISAYGLETLELPDQLKLILQNPLTKELWFFKSCQFFTDKTGYKSAYNGPGSYGHAVNAANMIWRQPGKELFQWHPDLETCLEEYCSVVDRGETLITGPASGGKTFGAALYAVLSCISDPDNTGVLGCSTTLPGLKRRFWGDVRRLFMFVQNHPMFSLMNLVDSLTCLQSNKGDMQRGIFGIAVAEGSESKALGRIIGFHPPRLIVIVDELTDVGWAIVEACTNLFTGKQKAHFIGIGNAASIFDSHGKMCEPKEGWNAVNVEMNRWETKRGGVCIHIDGFKSPNVVADKIIYPFLLTNEDISKTAKDYGENSPQMWRMRRGFWCPEGTVNTVLSEPLINNCMCMSKANWESTKLTYAGLDPAFEGGDRCVLRFGDNGKDSNGKDILELGDIVIIKPDATKFNQRPLEYQIADRIKKECVDRGVPPNRFGMDITGAGAGLASIITEEWGAGFHRCHFASSPSDLPSGPTDSRPSNEVYHNKVAELWYYIRTLVTAYQLKGLDPETAVELCARRYEVKEKIKLESKSDMKSRPGAKSPDLADAVAVLADTIKHRGRLGEQSKARSNANRDWDRLVREMALGEPEYEENSIMAV